MIIASSFRLTLNNFLQRDIPPFRDSIQTAFFLATEMALVKQDSKVSIKQEYKDLLARTTQKRLT
jgi:hypothetical protein